MCFSDDGLSYDISDEERKYEDFHHGGRKQKLKLKKKKKKIKINVRP